MGTEPQAFSAREAEFTSAIRVFHRDLAGAVARPVAGSAINAGMGDRIVLAFEYLFVDSNPVAAADIIDFEVSFAGQYFPVRCQNPILYGGPGSTPSPTNFQARFFNLMDMRPTTHPAQDRATRLDAQWEVYRLPDYRTSRHPFERLAAPTDATKRNPAIVVTTPVDNPTLYIWFNSRGGDGTAPVWKTDEYLNITAFMGGMAGTF